MIVFQILVLFLCAGCGSVATDPHPNPDENEPDGLSLPPRVLEDPVSNRRDAGAADRDAIVPAGLACLRRAYGEHIARVEESDDGLCVVMASGARLLWDDGVERTFEEKLASPDLEDQMSIRYPAGRIAASPAEDDDPGRIRVEAFFDEIYGASARAVRASLVGVPWLPGRGAGVLKFNSSNGAADALREVSSDLVQRLPGGDLKYVLGPGGTFNWRRIAGTDRKSAHSWGIAIDISVKHSDYWRWSLGRSSIPVYRNRIPHRVAEIFEERGFVWGGKWYHFDTMHFEYRPELLDPACVRRGPAPVVRD